MTFFELLKSSGTAAQERKQAIAYKADGEGTKVIYKPLINLQKLYNDISIIGMYADVEESHVDIYRDFEPCLKVTTIYNDTTTEKFQSAAINYCKRITNYDNLCTVVENMIINNQYIKNDILRLLEIHGDMDLLQRAKQAKQEYLKRTEEEEQERKRAASEEEQKQAEAEKAEKERRRAEKREFLCGFADDKTDIQMERVYNILIKEIGCTNNGNICYKTRRDFIIDELAKGYNPEIRENAVHYYGSKWDVKKSKPKTEYRLKNKDGKSWIITKTEYQFAVYMKDKIA